MSNKRKLNISDFYNQSVWCYTRVSSKEQFLKNGSIETQVKRIKAFANENGLRITREFDAEFESSKRINTQKTLNELIKAVKTTAKSQRPKVILIWSPSRFGRAGSEHIELFVSLRRKYGVYLFAVSSSHNTFTDRDENEFSTQLLYAQKENFSRQDVIIPGMINALENKTFLSRAPRGYDHYGPRVSVPAKVQAKQEMKINKDGLLIKEAFKLKLYEGYTDKEIQTYLAENDLHIPKSSLNVMWLNPFYAGYFKNSLIPDTEIEGHWEPLISRKEFKILNHKLKYSSQNGIPKISGKTETPLTPKFLICSDCNCNMTSYLNKARQIYYYKCSDCNKTVNANTRAQSKSPGIHEQFLDYLNSLKLSKQLIELFSLQLEKYLDIQTLDSSSKKRLISIDINKLQEQYDSMEYRFAIGEINKPIFQKHSLKIKESIEQKTLMLDSIPTKKSNNKKVIKKFIEMAEKPGEYYKRLDLRQKRKLQGIMFPEGLQFSTKNKECRTSKMNLLFELTNSLSVLYSSKNEETQVQFALESHLVAGTGLEPVTFGL
ncbi:serine type site-specific integrase/recombinase [Psychroflexus torquis ATCC 700755]|uniref:Serine type site-specific integrase/recombinase n=1 Tax=Psychroflexus torquis (strain ATCC 700755 / CIP 106069 / ACAM 623) TaxID=313595 RepID=K4IBX8_PSYTT|nr:serine type site-specific integrase/recombinase [Psychroflexus torquis ATCC 700755]